MYKSFIIEQKLEHFEPLHLATSVDRVNKFKPRSYVGIWTSIKW